MRRMRKKGQVEDFVADLIPSLIIIAIGLYVLSNMHSVNTAMVDERGEQLRVALKEKTIVDCLSETVEVEGKEISLWELISLSYKNEKYQKEIIERLELVLLKIPVECLSAEIHYPDQSKLEFGRACGGEERTIALPTYQGQYITVKFMQGTVFD